MEIVQQPKCLHYPFSKVHRLQDLYRKLHGFRLLGKRQLWITSIYFFSERNKSRTPGRRRVLEYFKVGTMDFISVFRPNLHLQYQRWIGHDHQLQNGHYQNLQNRQWYLLSEDQPRDLQVWKRRRNPNYRSSFVERSNFGQHFWRRQSALVSNQRWRLLRDGKQHSKAMEYQVKCVG